MSEIEGRVKKLSIDQRSGEVYGFILEGVEGYFNYTKEEFRGQPWDEHPVGAIIKADFATADNGKRYVKTILRCDTETEPPPWTEEGGPAHVQAIEHKAAVVKAVEGAERDKNASVERSVAIKATADIVVAVIPHLSFEGDGLVQLGKLIDTCMEHFKE